MKKINRQKQIEEIIKKANQTLTGHELIEWLGDTLLGESPDEEYITYIAQLICKTLGEYSLEEIKTILNS